jgi:hypothetical protein
MLLLTYISKKACIVKEILKEGEAIRPTWGAFILIIVEVLSLFSNG